MNEKLFNKKDDKDIRIKISTLIIIKVNKVDLLIKYKFIGDRTIYNKKQDETIKIKKIKKEETEIKKDKKEENEIDICEINKNKIEKSDYFEGYQ